MRTQGKWVSLLCLAGALATACERNAAVEPSETTGPQIVSTTQSARLKQDVTLEVTKIEDSRCPANAVCITYGSAKVFFTLKNSTEQKTSELCLGDCGGGKGMQNRAVQTIALGGASYDVVLTEVRPYPGTSSDKPTAVVEIIRK